MNTPRPFRSTRVRALAYACVLAAVVTIGCGKKGPPLAPFAKAPAAPAEPTARRLGNRVEIRFTIPSADRDGQRPAHLDRVEVWAFTGQVPAPELFTKYATLVGTVPVRRPPPPPPDVEEGKPPPPPLPPSTEPGLDQGQVALVVDELTPDELMPVVVPEVEKVRAREEALRVQRLAELGPSRLTPPDLGTPLPPPLMRHYVVMGRNGGRRGASTRRLAVPLRSAPPAPPQPISTLAENYLELSWTAPPGLPQPVHKGTARPRAVPAAAGARTAAGQTSRPAPPRAGAPSAPSVVPPPTPPPTSPADEEEQAATPELPAAAGAEKVAVAASNATTGQAEASTVLNSRSLTGFPSVTVGYVVYEVAPPDQTSALSSEPGPAPALPRRATLSPIATTRWRDDKPAFGTTRCYVVRTVVTADSAVESEASPAVCVSPTDTFPPKAPTSLAAVASQGAISLIWDANTEADLAGYIVLRGQASGATMRPLMTEPIKETTYRDTTVRAGVRYVYAVIAVDTASPQNASPQSNRVEETAR